MILYPKILLNPSYFPISLFHLRSDSERVMSVQVPSVFSQTPAVNVRSSLGGVGGGLGGGGGGGVGGARSSRYLSLENLGKPPCRRQPKSWEAPLSHASRLCKSFTACKCCGAVPFWRLRVSVFASPAPATGTAKNQKNILLNFKVILFFSLGKTNIQILGH